MSVISNEGDRLPVPSGVRIIAAYVGNEPVFKSDIQGSVYKYEIETTDEEVRLVNFLGGKSNDWEGVETDIYIDWGDGTTYLEYGERLNTEKYNKDSKWKLTHQYQSSGQSHIITIKSVEPLMPVGCKVFRIDGTWPEDYYRGQSNLLKYDEKVTNERPSLIKIQEHSQTIISLGANLLDKWANTTSMYICFANWSALESIPDGFFKDNILSQCSSYLSCFSGCSNLKVVPDSLLGNNNNVVKNVSSMFNKTAVNRHITLINSDSLTEAVLMYQSTNVEEIRDDFLVNTPELTSVSGIFSSCGRLHDYHSNFLSNAPKLKNASSLVASTNVTEAKFNTNSWISIEDMSNMFFDSHITTIDESFFSPNIASSSAKRLSIDGIFSHSNSETGLILTANAFKGFANRSILTRTVSNIFTNSKIKSIEEGLFRDVFNDDNSGELYTLTYLFSNSKSPLVLPNIFQGCNGVGALTFMFYNSTIDYLPSGLFKDMVNLYSVKNMFRRSKINMIFRYNQFEFNKKITDWSYLFYEMTYKYADKYSIDSFMWLDYIYNPNNTPRVEVNISYMFYGSNASSRRLKRYQTSGIYAHSIDARNFDNKPLLTSPEVLIPDNLEVIGLDTLTFNHETTTYEVIIGVGAANTTLYLSPRRNPIGYDATAVIDWGDGTEEQITIASNSSTNTKVAQHSYNQSGTHKILITSNALILPYQQNLDKIQVVRVSGNIPNCNVKWDLSNYAVQSKYIDRYMQLNISAPSACVKYNGDGFLLWNGNYDSTAYPSAPTNFNYYLFSEFVFEGDVEDLRLTDIGWPIVLPLEVQIIEHDRTITTKVIDNLDQSLGSFKNRLILRVKNPSSTKVESQPWPNNSDKIVYIGGVFSVLDFNKKFIDLAPNLTAIHGGVFARAIETKSFEGTFKNLSKFDFIPDDLFYRTRKVVSFKECFANTPIFKVPDRLIHFLKTDVDCTRMFAGCTSIEYVLEPIEDSCTALINITDMFDGVRTRCWRFESNETVFERLWVTGDSKLGRYDDIDINITRDNIIGYCSTEIGDKPDYIKASVASWIFLDTFNYTEGCFKGVDAEKLFKFATMSINSNSTINLNFRYANNWIKAIKYLQKKHTSSGQYIYIRYGGYSVEFRDDIITDYTFFYNMNFTTITFDTCRFNSHFTPWSLFHISYPSSGPRFDRCVFAGGQKMVNTLPFAHSSNFFTSAIGSMTRYYYGSTVESPDYNGFTLGAHDCYWFSNMFSNSNIVPPNDFWGEKQGLFNLNNYVMIDDIFSYNTTIYNDCGLFNYLKNKTVSSIRYAFYRSSLSHIDQNWLEDVDVTKITSCYGVFAMSNISTLPNIDKLINVTDFATFARGTPIMSVPENYIKVTHNKAMTIDHMFADCPNLLVENKFIHPDSVMSSLSIDYALNNVITTVGEDDVLFADFPYDATYENRSRVIYLNESNTFMQELLLTSSTDISRTYTVKSVQVDDLVGYDVGDGVLIIVWGDGSKATYVKNRAITEEDINHVYQATGNYTVRIMATNLTAYVHTADYNTSQRIVSSFKYGTMDSIRQKGMSKMFGFNVISVPVDLFYDLSDVETVTNISGCFSQFRYLSELPVGIFDKFTNVTNGSSLLEGLSSQVGARTILRKGLFDKLVNVVNLSSICRNAKIRLEDGIFDKNINVENISYGFENCLDSVPVTIFHNMTKLSNVDRTFAGCSFVIDDSFGGFFKHNPMITSLYHTFVGVKISSLPSNMLEGLVNLTNLSYSFSSGFYTAYVWTVGYDLPASEITDSNNWTVPDEFFTHVPKVTNITACFAGHLKCCGYGADLFKPLTELNHATGVFYKCRLNEIHPNTISNIPTVGTLDINYMFAKTYVTNCPKFIGPISKTVNTKNSLDTVCGFLSESELFEGVTTSPEDIQSGYRQEMYKLVLEVETSSDITQLSEIIASEPESFPWTGYVTTLEIDDGPEIEIRLYEDIESQEQLRSKLLPEPIELTAGRHIIKIGTPFLSYPKFASGSVKTTRVTGSYGKMFTTSHPKFGHVYNGLKFGSIITSDTTLDGKDLYKYNTHLTSLAGAYNEVRCNKMTSDIFELLTEITSISSAMPKSMILESDYMPHFKNMKGLVTSFPYIASNEVSYSGDVEYQMFDDGAPKILTDVSGHMFKRLPTIDLTQRTSLNAAFRNNSVESVDCELFDKATICGIFSRVIGNIRAIDNETETKTLFSGLLPTVDVNMNYFIHLTNLPQETVTHIINNLGPFKGEKNVSIQYAFCSNTATYQRLNRDLRINIHRDTAMTFDFRNFWNGGKFTNIAANSVTLTGQASLQYTNMFTTCYTRREVVDVSEVFNIEAMTLTPEQLETTGLKTLNSFDVTVNFDTPTKMKLEYVGGETITSVTYVELKIGDSDWQTFSVETPEELAALEFDVPVGETLVLVSGAVLVMPVFEDPDKVTTVTGHMSNDTNNYVLEESGFSFGKYFSGATTFDVNLCGKFYVKDVDGNQTLNNLYKGMKNITEYPETLFRSYYNSPTVTITSVQSTFEDNTSLNTITRGQMQWLPHIKHVDKLYKNCSLTEIPEGYFAQQTEIESWYEVFANNRLRKIPSKLIYVKPNLGE